MTRAEIEVDVRRVARSCRGPRDQDVDRVLGRLVRLETNVTAAAIRMRGMLAKDATTDALLTALFQADQQDVAAAVDGASRQRCGTDINALMLAHPLDGEPKEAPCPSCGTVVRWTPAVYTETAEPAN